MARPTQLDASLLAKVQLEVEKLIVSKWTVAPRNAPGYAECVAAMNSGTLGGCCRLGGSTLVGKNDTGRAEILASLVRLAFHDAAPFNVADGKGAPNGCIDFNDADNSGLETVVQQLLALQTLLNATYNLSISLADLYQYAALCAVWCALPALPTGSSTTVMSLPFKWGRTDASSCDHKEDSGRLPDSEKAFGELHSLAQRWGMNMKDIAALSGAHALGGTKANQSGYSTPKRECGVGNCGGGNLTGQWNPNNALLNAQQYYALLLKFIWRRQTTTHTNGIVRHSFASDGIIVKQTLMLNTVSDCSSSRMPVRPRAACLSRTVHQYPVTAFWNAVQIIYRSSSMRAQTRRS